MLMRSLFHDRAMSIRRWLAAPFSSAPRHRRFWPSVRKTPTRDRSVAVNAPRHSPGDRLAVAEKAARWPLLAGRRPQDRGGTHLDGAGGTASAHVGANPTGTDRADADAPTGQVARAE